jgi:hypothetical protein
VQTAHRTLAAFLAYWLDSIVKPNLAPLSYVSYEGYVRLCIGPYLGAKRLDKLTVRDVREWLTKLATVCQCCAQGKDAKRETNRRKCCAVGDCCESYPSRRVIQTSRDAQQAALTHAVAEEELSKNVASLVKAPKPRRAGSSPGRLPRRASSSPTQLPAMTTSSRPGCSCSASGCAAGRCWA